MGKGNFFETIFSNLAFIEAYEAGTFWHGGFEKNILKESFSWVHLNDALSTNRITNDRFRLSVKDAHVTLNRQAFRPTKDAFGRPTDYLLINELHRQMQGGATGVFESVHEIFPEIETLVEALSTRYFSRSAANAYISFGTTSGFGVHNDDHDVLIFQIEGKKQWRFFGSHEKNLKATVDNLPCPAEENVSEEMILCEGEMLYIPKGTWHDVQAIGEPSLHLTVSLVYPSYHQYMEWLLTKNRFGVPYRDIKLQNKNLDEVAERCKSFFDASNSVESVAKFLSTYYSKYPSIRNRPCFPSLNAVSSKDSFQKIPFSFVDISDDSKLSDTYSILTLGKKYRLNQQEYKVLSGMQVGESYSGQLLLDLFGKKFETWEAMANHLKNLLDEGLIRKFSPTSE